MSEEKKVEPIEPKVEKVKPKETVVVAKDYLKNMEERMARLESVASKARLGVYDDKHRGPLGQIAGIRKIDDKFVVGWGNMIHNKVEQNVVTNKWEEVQEVEIYFIDGKKQKMTYKQWKDRYTKVKCPVISETINSNGSKDVTLELPEGEKVTLDIKFVN